MTLSSKRMVNRELSLIKFYFVLSISVIYFAAQLVISHWAHCLVLQIDAYHMLYNILSLITCIITVRMSRSPVAKLRFEIDQARVNISDDDPLKQSESSMESSSNGEGSVLKNTFGWTRIDVCGAVGSLCVLSALGFSVVAESLQTMVHASHHFSMTHTMLCWSRVVQAVPIVGCVGLIVNGICVLTIGGYTFHQSSLLSYDHELGDDVVISSSVQQYVQDGIKNRRRQSLVATFRDIFGTILVIVVGLIVYTLTPTADDLGLHELKCIHRNNSEITSHRDDGLHESKRMTIVDAIYYLDPGLCIVAVIVLALLSISYAKEAGRVLLLTIPDHINVKSLSEELHQQFPEITDIHELHVWQLTPRRIIASAHIVLQHAQGYLAIQNSVVDFLHLKGISHVTLQPEFVDVDGMNLKEFQTESPTTTIKHRKCFLPCDMENCREKQCCETDNLTAADDNNIDSPQIDPHLDANPCSSSMSIKMRMPTDAEPAELEPMI